MKKILHFLFLISVLASLGFEWPFFKSASHVKAPMGSHDWIHQHTQKFKSQARNIDEKVLRLGLIAYFNARKKGLADKELLTIIDYSKPSTEKRMWVLDLKNGKTLFNTWVSHGKNSGGLNSTSFSNQNGSLKSSIGVFLTANPYFGGNGYSLRLKGLEGGINDNAYRRSIVIHGAWYAKADIIRKYGQLGRSWGCPAVSTELARPLINTIKENTLVVAYYPDRRWISKSRFLVS